MTDEPTLDNRAVADEIAERRKAALAEALRRKQALAEQRRQFAARRNIGLKQRHDNKIRRDRR